ncbi:ScbR family autoregulator-binding transcription factor [Streptomyces fulvorobeus]|uniref:AcrR family transcriptional regulator n=1 Tax=Streptomyces fulvorobeus TaxID=284028 RepID=A0A7J0C833_9ACTN|nr:ScbR family autoregulator-binding transcription factor [Streptomyces fulvorobeus]NYE41705.1 AcrR family transcriptional regulator [Streptomyces fulvorobeus]GFM98073.1 gamma-butyrolactone-binding protein [Streptomyces fulvorobeus]
MARQQRAIRTRRVFLEAAAEVFDEHGYDAATIAAILERAGLTRGALYFHFTSKEELARGVLQEAVTAEGLVPQAFKLQEWVDIALLLAYRLPREPMLSASIRLSVDPRARSLFGTRWPDWIELGAQILTEAKARGELLPHVDPQVTSRLFVGAWTGVQLIAESMAEPPDLVCEISSLFELFLPNNAVPGVLSRLDTSPHRAERLLKESREAVAS